MSIFLEEIEYKRLLQNIIKLKYSVDYKKSKNKCIELILLGWIVFLPRSLIHFFQILIY